MRSMKRLEVAPPSLSRTDMPYIGICRMRPVPGHTRLSSSARTDPVRMNLPGIGLSSTDRLTAPRTSGTSCHSSSKIGSASPSIIASGAAATASRTAGSSRRSTVAARRMAAGNEVRTSSSRPSTIRVTYAVATALEYRFSALHSTDFRQCSILIHDGLAPVAFQGRAVAPLSGGSDDHDRPDS